MRMRRAMIAMAVAVIVVLIGATPASAAKTPYKEPVTPYADMPSQQTKIYRSAYENWIYDKYGAEGIRDLDTLWPDGSEGAKQQSARAQEFLESKGYPKPSEVSAQRTSTATKTKTSTAKVPKVATAAGKLTRGLSSATSVVGSFEVGFSIGDAGLWMYGLATGTNPLDAACGSDLEGVVNTFYVFSSPNCPMPFTSDAMNNDVEVIPPGWSGKPVLVSLYSFDSSWGKMSQSSVVWDVKSAPLAGGGTAPVKVGAQTSFLGSLNFAYAQGPDYTLGVQYQKADGTWTSAMSNARSGVVCADGGFNWGSYMTPTGCAPSSQTQQGYVSVAGQYVRYRLAFGVAQSASPTNAPTLFWYPEGTPNRPEGQSGDPAREVGCSIEWPDGQVTEVAGAEYLESVGFPIYSAGQACNDAARSRDGEIPKSVTVTSKNKETGVTTPVTKEAAPDYTPEERASLSDKTGKGLVLWKAGASCLAWEADCSGWWAATDRGRATGTDYSCTYGDATVSLAQCTVYQRTFEPSTDAPVITDPMTGEDVKWATDGDPANSLDPSVSISPGDQCMSEWSSVANPVGWVLHPVKCALVWAFVPTTSKVDSQWSLASEKWNKTMPGKIGGIVSTAFTVDAVTGCQGPHIFMPFSSIGGQWGWVDVDWYPLNACEDPAAQVAWWSRAISSCALIYLVGLGIVRRASATVNAPGLGS